MQTQDSTLIAPNAKRVINIYYGIKDRCLNPQNKNYHRYGGRGITVCEQWLNDRQSFIDWALSNGYKDELQIDRRNNDGNYEPDNCRWVTPKENCRNTSKTVKVSYGGENRPLIEWCEILNLKHERVYRHIVMDGKNVPDVLENIDLFRDNSKLTYEQLVSKKAIIKELGAQLNEMVVFYEAPPASSQRKAARIAELKNIIDNSIEFFTVDPVKVERLFKLSNG